MATIIVFAISLFVILVLLFAKWREERANAKNFVTWTIGKLDPGAQKVASFFDFKYAQITQTIKYIFLIVIPGRTEESFKEAKRAVLGQYQKQKDIIFGRKDLSNGNSASFYLKKIREDQENGKDGRIEE